MTVPDRRSTAERLGRALVELTRRPSERRHDPVALLGQVPSGTFVEMAAYHRVPGLVHRSLIDLGVDDPAYAGLRSAYQMAVLAHRRSMIELKTMVDCLGPLEHPWLVVKGPVLVELGYRDPGARIYEDLDLVVEPRDLGAAIACIEAAGGRLGDLNWPMVTRLGRAEIPMELPDGMLADLHWHLLVTPNARSRFDLSMAALSERRRTVSLEGVDVATLDPIDGILYLCLHGSLSGGHQLIWLKDLEMMLLHEPPDWDELVRRARRSGSDLVAAIQLDRTAQVLGTPVPSDVVEALAGGSPWWRWWRRRERQVGAARWGAYDGTGRSFMAATSAGVTSGVAQLVRSVADDVVRPAVVERIGGSRRGPADEETPPLYRPVGGRAAVDAYLQSLAGLDWE